MKTSEKWISVESIPLRYLLSKYCRLPLWHMDKNMVINQKENEQIHQLQVGYM